MMGWNEIFPPLVDISKNQVLISLSKTRSINCSILPRNSDMKIARVIIDTDIRNAKAYGNIGL